MVGLDRSGFDQIEQAFRIVGQFTQSRDIEKARLTLDGMENAEQCIAVFGNETCYLAGNPYFSVGFVGRDKLLIKVQTAREFLFEMRVSGTFDFGRGNQIEPGEERGKKLLLTT